MMTSLTLHRLKRRTPTKNHLKIPLTKKSSYNERYKVLKIFFSNMIIDHLKMTENRCKTYIGQKHIDFLLYEQSVELLRVCRSEIKNDNPELQDQHT